MHNEIRSLQIHYILIAVTCCTALQVNHGSDKGRNTYVTETAQVATLTRYQSYTSLCMNRQNVTEYGSLFVVSLCMNRQNVTEYGSLFVVSLCMNRQNVTEYGSLFVVSLCMNTGLCCLNIWTLFFYHNSQIYLLEL
jgi:hypothetical protein